MSGLPRELLKWLQSLDLTYSVKNVKRDFSNGFLIAEIFSRYYVQDVEMHSYDNGTSLQKKLDNWGQLNKFFIKRSIKLEREVIDDVVHCKSTEAPVKMITTIYTLLTGRELRGRTGDMASSGMDATADLPPFARPNATSLLQSNMKDSEMLTTLQDRNTAASRAQALLDDHSTALRNERTNEPARFQTGGIGSGSNYGNMLRGPPKPVSQEMESAPVRFQEVKVKAVDRNIAQLRASRDQLSGGYSYTGSSPGSVAQSGAGGPITAPVPQVAVLDVMTFLSDRVLADGLVGGSPLRDSAYLAFVKALPETEEEKAAGFFRGVAAEADVLSKACLQSPKQGWQLFNAAFHALGAAGGSDAVFGAVVSLLAAVGVQLVSADATVAQSLMQDFGLPRLLPLLQQQQMNESKMCELLRVLYAFSADSAEAHIDTIRWLQESLDDQRTFLQALTVLITLERNFSEELLDLYVYYCVIALGMPSGRLRAAALNMLPIVCQVNHQMVLQMQPRLSMLVDEPWWEVAAALGRLSYTLLSMLPGDAPEAAHFATILSRVLGNRNPRVLSTVLPQTGALLLKQPQLKPLFVSALLELPAQEREYVLRTASSWPSLAVAEALLEQAKEQQLEHLASAHGEVLSALLGGSSFASEKREDWQAWLSANKHFLYVGLCDEDLCKNMCKALLPLFSFLQELALPTFKTLLASLRMLPEHPDCQKQVDELLVELYGMGEPLAGVIGQLVAEFEPQMRSALPQSAQMVGA